MHPLDRSDSPRKPKVIQPNTPNFSQELNRLLNQEQASSGEGPSRQAEGNTQGSAASQTGESSVRRTLRTKSVRV